MSLSHLNSFSSLLHRSIFLLHHHHLSPLSFSLRKLQSLLSKRYSPNQIYCLLLSARKNHIRRFFQSLLRLLNSPLLLFNLSLTDHVSHPLSFSYFHHNTLSSLFMAEEILHALSQMSLGISDPPRFLSQKALRLSLCQAQYCVMVKRQHNTQSLRGLREFLVEKWKMEGGHASAIIQNDGIIHVFFESHSRITTLFEEEPWLFKNWVFTFDLEMNKEIPHFLEEFSISVRVQNIPPPFRNHLALMDIGGYLGKAEDSKLEHSSTTATQILKPECVNVHANLKFVQWVHFFEDQEMVLVRFFYDKLSNYCNLCGSLLHLMVDCPTVHAGSSSSSSQAHGTPSDSNYSSPSGSMYSSYIRGSSTAP